MIHRMRPRWTVRWALRELAKGQQEIKRKVDLIMTAQQDALDALVARIDAATMGIRQDIADLKAANPGVDFSALEEKVSGLEGLDAENPPA